jgi:hypothetical protein
LAGDAKKMAWNFQGSTEKLLAYAYVWANASDPDLYGEWDFEVRCCVGTDARVSVRYRRYDFFAFKTSVRCLQEWRQAQLQDYLEMTQEFMDGLDQSESNPQT